MKSSALPAIGIVLLTVLTSTIAMPTTDYVNLRYSCKVGRNSPIRLVQHKSSQNAHAKHLSAAVRSLYGRLSFSFRVLRLILQLRFCRYPKCAQHLREMFLLRL